MQGRHIYDDLCFIHARGIDIEIDWLRGRFSPRFRSTRRIRASISSYRARLREHLRSENVDLDRLDSLKFFWPAGKRKYMWAVDDRGVEHKVYVQEIK